MYVDLQSLPIGKSCRQNMAVQFPVGEIESGVLVDQLESCQYVTRNKAQILPLFATALPGGS